MSKTKENFKNLFLYLFFKIKLKKYKLIILVLLYLYLDNLSKLFSYRIYNLVK